MDTPRIQTIAIQFIDDGDAEVTIASAGQTLYIFGVAHNNRMEFWLLEAIRKALKPHLPKLKIYPSKRRHGNRPQRKVVVPDYADGHTVERIRHNGKALNGKTHKLPP